MSDNAQRKALKLIAEYNAELDDYGSSDQLLGGAYAPAGVKFVSTDCHTIALNFHTDRATGWRFLLEELEQGIDVCTASDCDACEEGCE